MLVGLSGYIAGYNGSFEFKSGDHYPEEVDYTFMRVFNAMFGALCVPLAYYTAKELRLSTKATWLVTLMVLCGMWWFDTGDGAFWVRWLTCLWGRRKLVRYHQQVHLA